MSASEFFHAEFRIEDRGEPKLFRNALRIGSVVEFVNFWEEDLAVCIVDEGHICEDDDCQSEGRAVVPLYNKRRPQDSIARIDTVGWEARHYSLCLCARDSVQEIHHRSCCFQIELSNSQDADRDLMIAFHNRPGESGIVVAVAKRLNRVHQDQLYRVRIKNPLPVGVRFFEHAESGKRNNVDVAGESEKAFYSFIPIGGNVSYILPEGQGDSGDWIGIQQTGGTDQGDLILIP